MERWRQWGEPAVASPIITALVISLVSIGAVAFQALKADIRAVETRLITVEATLREEIRAGEARQREDVTALREDVTALSDKLDRVLENLLAAR
ncbi:MAG: hypothetical protein OXF67_05770 [Cyanobacteria bacterium MAG CAR4_bin_6]|nr:hypothetical protein [Cyanobacteria bacterium MAG CAR4_bin_6]